jgi:biotin synthase-related radical SAM superfamily protein
LHHKSFVRTIPDKIRVSIGSAIVLELISGKLDALPTTIYLLTYRAGKCFANCGFCPQARESKSRADMLSRVTWPTFPTRHVLQKLKVIAEKKLIKRICIQALNYPAVFDDVLDLAKEIRSITSLPLSVSCQPFDEEQVKKLVDVGVDRIGIPLDAATEDIFEKIKGSLAKGPYMWAKQQEALKTAVKIFGKGRVSTHLIVGLGETEEEMVRMIQWCVDNGVHPGLFSFTPVPGTALESGSQPSLSHYRRIQVAHYLIVNGRKRCESMTLGSNGCLTDFGVSKDELLQTIRDGKPFLTSGCPGCNRPYYNERPGGPLYNYPRMPLPEEIDEIEKQIL